MIQQNYGILKFSSENSILVVKNFSNLFKIINRKAIFVIQGRYNVLKTEGAMQKLGGQKPIQDPIFDGFGSIF